MTVIDRSHTKNSLALHSSTTASSLANETDVQALFNQIAPVYDNLNDWLSLGLHRVWKQMTVDWSQPFSGATCLDICCGSGDLTRLLARAVGAHGHVVGLDFAVAQLNRARQRSQSWFQSDVIEWVEGDALAIPFPDNRFDAVTMGYGLRNVPDIAQSLRELHRVLKPHSKAAILDFHKPSVPVMKVVQQQYLQHLVVPVARQCGVEEEYTYIFPSLQRFPSGQQQRAIALDIGFSTAIHYAIAGGMMGVLVVQK